MELAEVVNPQYAFPVGFVLICAVFVFAIGFKSSKPPTFSQIVHAADERKTAGKKRKLKDKKSVQNNIFVSITNDDGRKQKSDNSSKVSIGKTSKQAKNTKDEAEKSPVTSNKQQLAKKKNISQKENVIESILVDVKKTTKDGKQSPEGKKIQPTKDANVDLKIKSQEKRLLKEKNYNIQQVKANKNTAEAKPKSSKSSKSKLNEEKPIDFDEGEWEQAISRKEKKSKKKDEEALMAANALNSRPLSPSVKQSAVISSLPKNDSVDLSAPATNADSCNLVRRSGSSNDTSTTNDYPNVGSDISGPICGNAVARDVQLSGDNEKKESTTKAANTGASSPQPNEKPKSSKSKGKNKESSVSLQKDVPSQGNENISAVSAQPPAEESTKTKKKKKQSNAADNKEGKTPAQPVEAPKPQTIEVEVANDIGEFSVAHDLTANSKIVTQAAVVFDELGDVWKEAKAPKKNKKKVRKDQ